MTYGPPGPQPDPYGQQPDHGQQQPGYGTPGPQDPYGGAPGYGQTPGQPPGYDSYGYAGQVQPYGYGPGGPPVTQDDRTWAMLGAYLGQLLLGFVSPLIVYLARKDQSPFLRHHGAQGLNFAITQFVYSIVSFILMIVLIGFLTLLAQSIAALVFLIMAAVASNRGEWYRFPAFMAWPMIK